MYSLVRVCLLNVVSDVCRRNAHPQAFCRCGRERNNFLSFRMRTWTLHEKKKFLTATFLLSSNNSTTKFQLHLQFFAHTMLLKAGPGFWYWYILNTTTVADSADADARQLSLADVDATCRCGAEIPGSARLWCVCMCA